MREMDAKNDLNKMKTMIEMFSQIEKLTFLTPEGIEFSETIKSALNENIKPYAREKYKLIESKNK